VESNNFGTQKVVASCEIGGDLDVDFSTARVHVFDAPVIIVARVLVCRCPSVFVD
jgi:hypothetical protein